MDADTNVKNMATDHQDTAGHLVKYLSGRGIVQCLGDGVEVHPVEFHTLRLWKSKFHPGLVELKFAELTN